MLGDLGSQGFYISEAQYEAINLNKRKYRKIEKLSELFSFLNLPRRSSINDKNVKMLGNLGSQGFSK